MQVVRNLAPAVLTLCMKGSNFSSSVQRTPHLSYGRLQQKKKVRIVWEKCLFKVRSVLKVGLSNDNYIQKAESISPLAPKNMYWHKPAFVHKLVKWFQSFPCDWVRQV